MTLGWAGLLGLCHQLLRHSMQRLHGAAPVASVQDNSAAGPGWGSVAADDAAAAVPVNHQEDAVGPDPDNPDNVPRSDQGRFS